MTLEASYHPEATAELRADVSWYDERGDGLGARFEARLVYVLQGDELVVVAIAHTKRKPGYWRDRVS